MRAERLDRRGSLAVSLAFGGVLHMRRPSLRVDSVARLVSLMGAALAARV
jgi:hypothetical protein